MSLLRSARRLCILTLSFAATTVPAQAQDAFPTRPIRIVVGSEAGSAPDLIARVVAEQMGPLLKGNVVVDNRPGAAGTLGATLVTNASPDGTTLLMGTVSNISLASSFYPIKYDPLKDFTAIGMVAAVPLVLVTSPAFDAPSFEAFKARITQGPEPTFSSPGIGGPQHLAGVLLMRKLGRPMLHVPYKSGGAAMTAVASGEVQFAFAGIPAAASLASAKRVVPVMVTAATRSPAMPETPSATEAGMPDFQIDNWHALVGPAGIPAPIRTALETALRAALTSDKVRQQFLKLGAVPAAGDSRDLEGVIASETARWSRFVIENKLKER